MSKKTSGLIRSAEPVSQTLAEAMQAARSHEADAPEGHGSGSIMVLADGHVIVHGEWPPDRLIEALKSVRRDIRKRHR